MSLFKVSLTSLKDLSTVIGESKGILREKEPVETKTDEQIFHDAMADVREIPEFWEIRILKPRKKDHLS